MPDGPLRVTEDGVRFRAAPGLNGTILQELKAGAPVYPTGAPLTDADGHRWRQVALAPIGWVADEFLAAAPAGITFNPDFPLRRQVQDWTCSIRTTQMVIEGTLGVTIDVGVLQAEMCPRYVNPEVGLLDGSGRGIVEVLSAHGIQARSIAVATFSQVANLAGTTAIGLGGHGWGGVGHWVAVRRFRDGALELGNPAGTGPRFGQQRIDEGTWNSLASSWSAVVVTGQT